MNSFWERDVNILGNLASKNQLVEPEAVLHPTKPAATQDIRTPIMPWNTLKCVLEHLSGELFTPIRRRRMVQRFFSSYSMFPRGTLADAMIPVRNIPAPTSFPSIAAKDISTFQPLVKTVRAAGRSRIWNGFLREPPQPGYRTSTPEPEPDLTTLPSWGVERCPTVPVDQNRETVRLGSRNAPGALPGPGTGHRRGGLSLRRATQEPTFDNESPGRVCRGVSTGRVRHG